MCMIPGPAVLFMFSRERLVNDPPQDLYFQSLVQLAGESLNFDASNHVEVVRDLLRLIRDDFKNGGAVVTAAAAVDIARKNRISN